MKFGLWVIPKFSLPYYSQVWGITLVNVNIKNVIVIDEIISPERPYTPW